MSVEQVHHASGSGRKREPSDLRTLARGGTLNLVGAVTSGVLGFALALVVTRGLGPGGTGVFYAAVALFTILSNATELGADTGLVRAITRYRTLGRVRDIRPTLWAALWPVLGAGTLVAAAVWVFAAPLARLVNHGVATEEVVEYIRVLSPFLVVASVSTVSLSGSRGFGTMVPYVLVESIGKPAARAALVAAAVVLGMGSTAIVAAWAAPLAVGFFIGVAVILGQTRHAEVTAGTAAVVAVERPTRRALAVEFWRFAAARGVAGVFQISVIWLDILLVSFLTDRTQTGVYSAASRLVTVGTFALQAMRLAIAPQIGELLTARRNERAEDLYQVATWWLMAVSWPLYLLLAVFSPFVLGIFGSGFREGQTALMILALAMLVNLGTGNVTVVLLMGGKSSWNLFNTAGALTINIGLNILLIPHLGIRGAALAWAASIAFDNIAALIEVRAFLGLRPFGAGYALVAGGAVVCFGLVGLGFRALLGDGAPAMLAAIVVGGGAYVALLWRAREVLHLSVVGDVFRARWVSGEVARVVSDRPPEVRPPLSRAGRGLAKRGLRTWGVITSSSRPLPDFLIIGAKRGGTTSLFNYLQQHPNVAPLFPAAQRIKGADFFDMNYAQGVRWYRSFFPTDRQRRGAERRLGSPVVVGEASPYYIFHPLAPERAAKVAPSAKIVVLLRDPVDRAYSHYRERVRHGVEPLSFEDAIAAEPGRLAGEVERLLADPTYHSVPHEQFSYVAQGRYAEQLEAWFEHFPRERFLFLRSQDLFTDPEATFARTLGFLGLPPYELDEYEAFNYHPGRGIEPETRRRLQELFAPEIRRLESLLGIDLGWDARAPG